MSPYPLGKLPQAHLEKILSAYRPADSRLIVGGKVGEDAAVIDMGAHYLVAKTDPITFATDQIGWYAVNVNANDIASMGATPKWFLATLLLPENKTTPVLVDRIFEQITSACTALNITLVGGHTEITYGLERPIVAGQMLGEVKKEGLVLSGGTKVGDDLLLTKAIAIEGTAIIAQEKRDILLNHYSAEEIDRLGNLLHNPGISVVTEALAAVEVGGVHAMHDPTEGGIATGLLELATAANVGLEIFANKLPLLPECTTLCQLFNLNPLGLIASGSLLMAVDPNFTPAVLKKLNEIDIQSTVIGRVRPPEYGLYLSGGSGKRPLPVFSRDEITRLFE